MTWKIDDVDKVYALGKRSDGWAFAHGMGVGALAGLGIGVGVSALLLAFEHPQRCSDVCFPPAAVTAILTLPFTALTTVVGGVVGLGFRDKWRSVPIPLAPAQSPK